MKKETGDTERPCRRASRGTGDTVRFEDVSEIGAVIRALESAKEQSEESKELVGLLDQMLMSW